MKKKQEILDEELEKITVWLASKYNKKVSQLDKFDLICCLVAHEYDLHKQREKI